MEAIVWTVDWNPEFDGETRLKREITKALRDSKTIAAVKRFADQAIQEALDDGLETEHILWLDSSFNYAFFVRVWYEVSEGKLFIVIEENDLGDVGFLLIRGLECASYNEGRTLTVELRDPEDLGVSR